MLAILIFQFNHQCAVQSSMIPEEATSYFNGGSRGNFINAVSTRGGSDKESEGSRTSFAGGFFSILEDMSVCCYSKTESEGSRTSFAGGCFSILDDMNVCCYSKSESESRHTSFAGDFFPIPGVWSLCREPISESEGSSK